MATLQLNPALLDNKVFEVGEIVHLAVPIQGHYYHGGHMLAANASFVGTPPPTSYGPTNNMTRAVFRVESRSETPKGVSITTPAEKWTYKISLQLPAQLWKVPFTAEIVPVISHMSLSKTKSGQPAPLQHNIGDTVFLTKAQQVMTNDPNGKTQDLKAGFELTIGHGPRSRTKATLMNPSTDPKKFRGNNVYYTCTYMTVKETTGCYWKSDGLISHQFIRPVS